MFNIFTFTKDVTNMTKLDRELRANTSFGSLYADLTPFVTETRLTPWKDKILAKLA